MGNVIFIDADGRRYDTRSSLAAQNSRGQSHKHGAVENLAHSQIQVGDGWLKVRVDLVKASDKSLLGLVRELGLLALNFDCPVFFDDMSGVIHRLKNARAALLYVVQQLSDLMTRTEGSLVRRPIAMVASHHAFHALASACRGSDVLNFGAVRNVLQSDFANRYCVVRPDTQADRLVLQEFGDGYEHLDGNWERRKAGTPFGEFDDREYSTFVQKAYLEAWQAWRPTLEDIKVPRFKPPLPERYQRILLPIRLATGPAMLSASRY